jgi:hypothetical protein
MVLPVQEPSVVTLDAGDAVGLADVAFRYGLSVDWAQRGATIHGSYWGEPEAGLVGDRLLVRPDTPLHSALHEMCHYVCMPESRRRSLDRDAGGDDLEESAVCYLQVVLSDYLSGFGRDRMFRDMNAWGYSFRFDSTRRWFESDAGDARLWLRRHRLIDGDDRPAWRLGT